MPALPAVLHERFGGLGRAFWALQVGLFVNRAGQFVQPLLTWWLTSQHGFSVTAAGAVVSTYSLGSALGSTLGGAVADRAGRRTALLLSAAGATAMLAALGFAERAAAIVVGAFLLAVVYDLHRPAVQAMVADLTPPSVRLRAYALTYVTVNLGFAVAPALAGWLAGRSYGLMFAVAAGVQAAWAVYVLLRLPETRPERAPGVLPGTFGDVLRDRTFLVWCVALGLSALLPHQGFVALAAWMKHQGYAAETYGTVLGVNGVLIVLVQPWVAEPLNRVDPVRCFAAGALLQGVGFAMHGLDFGVAGHVAAVVVWTLGEIVTAPVTSAVVSRLAPPDLRGRYQGMVALAFSCAGMLGPLIGAAALDRFGASFWPGLLGLGVVSALVMVRIGPALRERLALAAA